MINEVKMFRFKLAAIKRLREYVEDRRREEVGQCLQLLAEAEKEQLLTRKRIQSLSDELSALQTGPLDLAGIVLVRDYLAYQGKRLAEQVELTAKRKEELAQVRLRYHEAVRDRKIINKLEEKHYRHYLSEQNKREQAMLDEQAQHLS